MHIRQGNLIMNDWFTVEEIDTQTYSISEYQHWEETHCYLICGKEKAVLIDTGLGICNIRSVALRLLRSPLQCLPRTFIGIILEGINILRE